MNRLKTIKVFLIILCFTLFISCSAKAQTVNEIELEVKKVEETQSEPLQVIEKDLKLIETGSTISLYWYEGKNESIVQEFNRIDSFKKRFYTFSNKSIVGYLPVRNPEIIVKNHSDLNHEFELFYCNIDNGEIQSLNKNQGWSFNIVATDNKESRWIIIATNELADLFLLNENGKISKRVNFEITFRPDIIKFQEISENGAKVLFGILGKDAIYEIDFTNLSVHLLGEEVTVSH